MTVDNGNDGNVDCNDGINGRGTTSERLGDDMTMAADASYDDDNDDNGCDRDGGIAVITAAMLRMCYQTMIDEIAHEVIQPQIQVCK